MEKEKQEEGESGSGLMTDGGGGEDYGYKRCSIYVMMISVYLLNQ